MKLIKISELKGDFKSHVDRVIDTVLALNPSPVESYKMEFTNFVKMHVQVLVTALNERVEYHDRVYIPGDLKTDIGKMDLPISMGFVTAFDLTEPLPND